MKRILALLLALISTIGFVACSGDGKPNDSTDTTDTGSNSVTTTAVSDTAPATDADGYLLDSLPKDLNYGNAKVRTLYWNDVEHAEFIPESDTGDNVDDAIFRRNSKTEARLGVELEFIGIAGNVNHISDFVTNVESTYSGGEAYDIIGSYSSTAGSLASRGLSTNLLSLEHLNFDAPWWPESLVDTFTLKDNLYFCSGDLSTNLLYMMHAMFFNKDYITRFNKQDLYELVQNGTWTFSNFAVACENVYEDVNPNNIKDSGDRFGYATYWLHLDCLFGSIGVKSVEKNADDLLAVSPSYGAETTGNFLKYIVDKFQTDNDWYYAGTGGGKVQQKIFAEGRSFFMSERVRVCKNVLRSTNLNYSILPVPKYDENQADYITTMAMPFTIYTIPTNAPDTERAGAVLECLSSEGYRLITPALFELSMKSKYSKDEVTSQMFDLIRQKVTFDLGRVFNEMLAKIPNATLRNMVDSGSTTWSNKYDSIKDPLQGYIDEINKSLNK